MSVTTIQKHTLSRPQHLIECEVVLDIGPGLRPMQWYKPQRHICIDPYMPYVAILIKAGYEAWCSTGANGIVHAARNPFAAKLHQPIGAIYLLDVIEHMEPQEALCTIARARYIATRQVVVYTPYGFVEQTQDKWGLGGDEWQTHRSGWLPTDFPDAEIEYYYGNDPQMCCPSSVGDCGCGGRPVDPPEGFFAVWTTPTKDR